MATDVTRIKETFIERRDDDHSYVIGQSEWYEPFTADRGRLFRDMQREYGRCVSRVYMTDHVLGDKPIGWVFEKRMQYEDTGRYGRKPEYYTREVWVELAPDAWGNGI